MESCEGQNPDGFRFFIIPTCHQLDYAYDGVIKGSSMFFKQHQHSKTLVLLAMRRLFFKRKI